MGADRVRQGAYKNMARHRQKSKSEYGAQLEEKQGMKATYALRERQFRRYFDEGENPETIMQLLERRFDNVVFRCGFAQTRKAARQLVSHGHIQVNGKNVNIPSLRINVGDVVSIHPTSSKIGVLGDLTLTLKKHETPAWIDLDKKELKAKIVAHPAIADPIIISSIKPIIEFYSR